MLIGGSLSKIINKGLVEGYIETHREYVGASSIGNTCMRAIWYAYKGMKGNPVPAKQIRTFEIGHRLEKLLKDETRFSGIHIYDPSEFEWIEKELPLFKGTPDAVISIDEKYAILEIKTANDSSYNTFLKKGVREWRPQYYSQIQAYMGFSQGAIKHAYIIVLNKNTSEIHDEYIPFDEIHYHELKQKAKVILESSVPPGRINKNPIFYVCAMCRFKDICHSGHGE